MPANKSTILNDRSSAFRAMLSDVNEKGIYPFFRAIDDSNGVEVVVDGRRVVMVGSNDYLGLSHDPEIMEAAADALRRWGAGPGGSRFLCGNMTLHEQLEERLADCVGKKAALVHATGFSANHGVLGCLAAAGDSVIMDRESHASIVEGARASCGRMCTFAHNDSAAALKRVEEEDARNGDGIRILVTEGVFSMSGNVGCVDELTAIRNQRDNVMVYLDDAHGLGVMGQGGRGTAVQQGVERDVDIIMGTFSKALASVGGFVAVDDMDLLSYLKHHSRTMIFSAALPAVNAAVALKALDIIEKDPQRVQKLWDNAEAARKGFLSIGFDVGQSDTPIIPVFVGDEKNAFAFSAELFERGVFALPAVYPAVPRGQAIIRTAFMSTHEPEHVQKVLEVFHDAGVARGLID